MNVHHIVAILVEHRQDSAMKVQALLSEGAMMIKTRLGLNDGVGNACAESGLMILEMLGDEAQMNAFVEKLNNVDGVEAQKMTLGH